jgi:transposase-like protein
MRHYISPKTKKDALEYFFTHDVSYNAVVREFSGAFSYKTFFTLVKNDERFKLKKLKWKYYTTNEKLEAIKLYNLDGISVIDIANKLNIRSISQIYSWIRLYAKDGTASLSRKGSMKGECDMKKIREPEDKDSLEHQIFELQLENDILSRCL